MRHFRQFSPTCVYHLLNMFSIHLFIRNVWKRTIHDHFRIEIGKKMLVKYKYTDQIFTQGIITVTRTSSIKTTTKKNYLKKHFCFKKVLIQTI